VNSLEIRQDLHDPDVKCYISRLISYGDEYKKKNDFLTRLRKDPFFVLVDMFSISESKALNVVAPFGYAVRFGSMMHEALNTINSDLTKYPTLTSIIKEFEEIEGIKGIGGETLPYSWEFLTSIKNEAILALDQYDFFCIYCMNRSAEFQIKTLKSLKRRSTPASMKKRINEATLPLETDKRSRYPLHEYTPWAFRQVLIVLLEQYYLAQSVIDQLSILKKSKMYKLENGLTMKEEMVHPADQVFEDLFNAIKSSDIEIKAQLVAAVEDMKQEIKSGSNSTSSYNDLIGSIANHMAVLGPFVSALKQFVSN
jgi:hypothetical protein